MIIAKWRKGTYNKDKTGTEVADKSIRVIETGATRFDANPTDGVTSHDWTLVLESDTPSAREIQAGDMIVYNKHRYTVQKDDDNDDADNECVFFLFRGMFGRSLGRGQTIFIIEF